MTEVEIQQAACTRQTGAVCHCKCSSINTGLYFKLEKVPQLKYENRKYWKKVTIEKPTRGFYTFIVLKSIKTNSDYGVNGSSEENPLAFCLTVI